MVKENAQIMSHFYFSNKMLNRRRAVEPKKKRVYGQVPLKEREFLRQASAGRGLEEKIYIDYM